MNGRIQPNGNIEAAKHKPDAAKMAFGAAF
jgi:hypothetical protein